MRSTLYVAPASSDVLKNSQIPFAVAISPFAPLTQKEVMNCRCCKMVVLLFYIFDSMHLKDYNICFVNNKEVIFL